MGKLAGSCLCGAVRYESDAEPVVTAICHCKHCQKQSGSAFSVIVAVPKGALKLQGRPLAVVNDVGESSQPVMRKFCPDCGSPVLSDVTTTPTLDWVKAGTLDDATCIQPRFNIWCEHAQPWVLMDEALPKVPRNSPLSS